MLELVLVGQVLGRFWAGSAAVAQIPERLHAGGLLGCFAVATAVAPAGAAAAVAGVRGDESLSRTLWSPCLLLFLPEEFSFFRRTLTPVVSTGSPCGHLGTQWRCLSLPPIPSIRMLVSASAAACAPASGLQTRCARSLGTFWTPGPGHAVPLATLQPSGFGGGCGLGALSLEETGLSREMGLEPGLGVWKEPLTGLLAVKSSGGTAGAASGAGTVLLGEQS